MRLFKSCDLDDSGMIGISELEVALMTHDIIPTTPYMTPLDSFYTFDLDGGGDISWVEFQVCVTLTTSCQPQREAHRCTCDGEKHADWELFLSFCTWSYLQCKTSSLM